MYIRNSLMSSHWAICNQYYLLYCVVLIRKLSQMDLSYEYIPPRDGMELHGAGEDRWKHLREFPAHVDPVCHDKSATEWDAPVPGLTRPPNLIEKYTNPCKCDKYKEFWLHDFSELLSEPYLLPSKTMTLNQKLNSFVRGTAVLCACIYLFSTKYSRKIFYILILSILLSIFMYYTQDACTLIHDKEYIIQENKMKMVQNAIRELGMEDKEFINNNDVILIVAKIEPQFELRDIKELLADLEVSPDLLPLRESMEENKKSTINDADFNVPEDYNWERDTAPMYDQKLFCGIDQNVENEMEDQREILLSYGDRLNADFEHTLTKDFYGDSAQSWRDEGTFLVDRDIYHPRNADLFFDPW